MSVRPLRLIGDPVLRAPCDRVVRFDDALHRLVTDLLDTVQEPGRAGLAANQIGSSLAVFSYNVDGALGYVINPVIARTSGEQDGYEGCLSVPGVSADRHRAACAVVTGVDLDQQPVTVEGEGEFARCLQHETDHLAGELYIDKLTGRSAARCCARSGARRSTRRLTGLRVPRDPVPAQVRGRRIRLVRIEQPAAGLDRLVAADVVVVARAAHDLAVHVGHEERARHQMIGQVPPSAVVSEGRPRPGRRSGRGRT